MNSYGDGYFSEIGPQQQTVGFPPYISAHGSYTSCVLDLMINTSIWDKEGWILTELPEELETRRIEAERISSPGNILLGKLVYDALGLSATLEGDLNGYVFDVHVPKNIRDSFSVTLNGKMVPFEKNGENVRIFINTDSRVVEIKIF